MGASEGMVDVASLARSTASECALSLPGLRVDVTVPGEIWVPTDVELIRGSWQGYCHLMANRLSLAEALWITAELDREGARVHLVAEDDGPPIPPAEWNEVWLPGLRDGASSGSPVARLLAIDQIRAMGGDISVGTGASATSAMMSLPTLLSPTRGSDGAH